MSNAKRYLTSVEVPIGDYEGHQCFDSREEAQKWCDEFNEEMKDSIADPESGIEKATVIELGV